MATRAPAVKDAVNPARLRASTADQALGTSASSASAPRSYPEHTNAATEAYRDIEGNGSASGSKFNEEWGTNTSGSKHSRGISTSSADHMILSSRTGNSSRLASGTMRDHDAGAHSVATHSSQGPKGSSHSYNQEQLSSPFHCPIPTETNPSEVLASRFENYRQILKDLIAYFEGTGSHYESRAKAHQRLQQATNSFKIPQEFLQNGGLADGLGVLHTHSQLSMNEAEKSQAIEEDVIAALTSLRSELTSKIKEIRGLTSDFKSNIEHEMDGTKKAVRSLNDALSQNASETESSATGKSDPYLLRHSVDRQIEKQLKEENYLQQAHNNLETSGRELESIVVYEIQKSFNAIAGILKRESTLAYNTSEDLRSGVINMPRDTEWNHWVQSGDDMFLTNTPKRTVQQITYPGMDHPSCHMIRSGPLERKGKYLKSFTAGWYVLSPTHLHEFKSADSQTPVMSLYLPDQTLGSHSASGGSNNKFILKGRQTGTLHRGHTWIFRAENYEDMLGWYREIKALLEPSFQAGSGAVGGAALGGAALGGAALGADARPATKSHHKRTTSSGYRSSSSDSGALNEEDETPWAGINSQTSPALAAGAAGAAGATGAATTREASSRPMHGGRFSSTRGEGINDPSMAHEAYGSSAPTHGATGVPAATATTAAYRGKSDTYPVQKSQPHTSAVAHNHPVSQTSTTSQYQTQPQQQRQYQAYKPGMGSTSTAPDSSSQANWGPAALAAGAAAAAGAGAGAYAVHQHSSEKNRELGPEESAATRTGGTEHGVEPSQSQYGSTQQYPISGGQQQTSSSGQQYSTSEQDLTAEQQRNLASRGFNVGGVAVPASASAFDKSQAYEGQNYPDTYSSQAQTTDQLSPTTAQHSSEKWDTDYPHGAALGAGTVPALKNKNISRPQSNWSTEEIRSSSPANITGAAATGSNSGHQAENQNLKDYWVTKGSPQKQGTDKAAAALAATGLAGAGTTAALSHEDKQNKDTTTGSATRPSKYTGQSEAQESGIWNPLSLGKQVESTNSSSAHEAKTGLASGAAAGALHSSRSVHDHSDSATAGDSGYPSGTERLRDTNETHKYPGSYPDEESTQEYPSSSSVGATATGAAGTATAATGLASRHHHQKNKELERSERERLTDESHNNDRSRGTDPHAMGPSASTANPSRTDASNVSSVQPRSQEYTNRPREENSSPSSTGIIGTVMGAVGLGGAAAAISGNHKDSDKTVNQGASVEENPSRPDISRAALGSSGALPRDQRRGDNLHDTVTGKSRADTFSSGLGKDAPSSSSRSGGLTGSGSSGLNPGGATTMPTLAGTDVSASEIGGPYPMTGGNSDGPDLSTSGGKQLDVNPNEPHVLGSTDRPKAWSMVDAAEQELRELGQLPAEHDKLSSGPVPAMTSTRDRRGSTSLKPTPRTNENLYYQVSTVPGQLIPTPETHRRRLSQVSNPDPALRRGSLGAIDQSKSSATFGEQNTTGMTSHEASQSENSGSGMLGGIGATVAGAATAAATAVGLTKQDSASSSDREYDSRNPTTQATRTGAAMTPGTRGNMSTTQDYSTDRYTSPTSGTVPTTSSTSTGQRVAPTTSHDTTQSQSSGGMLGGIGATVAGAAAAAATAVGLKKQDSATSSGFERDSRVATAPSTSGNATTSRNPNTSHYAAIGSSTILSGSHGKSSTRDALPIVGGGAVSPTTSRQKTTRRASASSVSSSDYDSSDNERTGGVSTRKTATGTVGRTNPRLQGAADPEKSLGSNVGDMLAGAAVGAGVGTGASKLAHREKKQEQESENARSAYTGTSNMDSSLGRSTRDSLSPSANASVPTATSSNVHNTTAGPYYVTQSTPTRLDGSPTASQTAPFKSSRPTSRTVKEDYWDEPIVSRGQSATAIPTTQTPAAHVSGTNPAAISPNTRDTPGTTNVPGNYENDEDARSGSGSGMGLGATVAAALGAGAAALGLSSSHDDSIKQKEKEYSSSISSSSDYEDTTASGNNWAPASAYKNTVTSAGVASASGKNAAPTSASKSAKTAYSADGTKTYFEPSKHTHSGESSAAVGRGVGAAAAATAAAAAMAAPGHHDDDHSGAYHIGPSGLRHTTEPALRTNEDRDNASSSDNTYRMAGSSVPHESESYNVPSGVTSKHVHPQHDHTHTPVVPVSMATKGHSSYHMKAGQLDHPQDDITASGTTSSRGMGTTAGVAAGTAAGAAALGAHSHSKNAPTNTADNSGLSEEWSGPWNRETDTNHPMTLKEELQEAVHDREARGYGQTGNSAGQGTNPSMVGGGPTFFASETTDSTAATVGSNSSQSTPTGSRFSSAGLGSGGATNTSAPGPTATTGVRSAAIPAVTGPGVTSSDNKQSQDDYTMTGTRGASRGETADPSRMTSSKDYGASDISPGAAPIAPGPSQTSNAPVVGSSYAADTSVAGTSMDHPSMNDPSTTSQINRADSNSPTKDKHLAARIKEGSSRLFGRNKSKKTKTRTGSSGANVQGGANVPGSYPAE